jgi:hypothetical protein
MPSPNLPAEGAIGIAPPPDAPYEVTQPLQADAGAIHVFDPKTGQPTGEVLTPRELARQHERELLPLTYGKTQTETSDPRLALLADMKAQMAAIEKSLLADPVPATQGVQPAKPVVAADKSQPAASNTDSPSRGMPGTAPTGPRDKPRLEVTGGFGEADQEYYPLDGTEVLALAGTLLDDLWARLQNDLRFSVAITYPRLNIKAQLAIQGEAADQDVIVERVLVKDRTPLEVAQAHGDSVIFCVTRQKREFDDAENVETPADAIRDELGLIKPRKRKVGTGGLADVSW